MQHPTTAVLIPSSHPFASPVTLSPLCTTGAVGSLLGDLLAQSVALLGQAAARSARNTEQPAAAQAQPEPPRGLDWRRTARLVTFSTLVGTPLALAWYDWLDANVLPSAATSPQVCVWAGVGGVWFGEGEGEGQQACSNTQNTGAPPCRGASGGQHALLGTSAVCALWHAGPLCGPPHPLSPRICPRPRPLPTQAVVAKMLLDQALLAPSGTLVFFFAMRAGEGVPPADALRDALAKLKPALRTNWSVWPLVHLVNFSVVPPQQRILFINSINVSGRVFNLLDIQGSICSRRL